MLGSVSDIVVDGVTGVLAEVSSESSIEGVSRLLHDPALGIQLGKSGKKRAEMLFSSKAMVKHHEDVVHTNFLNGFHGHFSDN